MLSRDEEVPAPAINKMPASIRSSTTVACRPRKLIGESLPKLERAGKSLTRLTSICRKHRFEQQPGCKQKASGKVRKLSHGSKDLTTKRQAGFRSPRQQHTPASASKKSPGGTDATISPSHQCGGRLRLPFAAVRQGAIWGACDHRDGRAAFFGARISGVSRASDENNS